MCLTIPKKVAEISQNTIIVELHDGTRQQLKSLIPLEIGDYVMSQQNIIIEKIDKEEAEEIFEMIKTKREVEKQ